PLSSPTPPTPHPHPLSLHDALPILPAALAACRSRSSALPPSGPVSSHRTLLGAAFSIFTQRAKLRKVNFQLLLKLAKTIPSAGRDRKSTRLNSSHLGISYAVFCLKK